MVARCVTNSEVVVGPDFFQDMCWFRVNVYGFVYARKTEVSISCAAVLLCNGTQHALACQIAQGGRDLRRRRYGP